MFVELGIFDKRFVARGGRNVAFRKVVFVAIATAATRCTVARRRAVFVLRVRRGGKGSATFALASMITTVVSARARRFFRISRSVAGTFISRTAGSAARNAVAHRAAVFMVAGTRARRLALLTLAFTGATIVCARAFFVVWILFFVAVGAILERAVARTVIVFMRAMRSVAAFFAGASVFTTIVSACAFFIVRIIRIVGLVAIATVLAVRFVATGFSVFMVLVRFAGEMRAALAYM